MDRLVVTKLGYIGVAPHRYIDVLANKRIEKFRIFFFENEKNSIIKLINDIKKYFPQYMEKLEVMEFPWYKILNYKLKLKTDIINLIPNSLKYFIKNILVMTDILWIGDNDFDGSFSLYDMLYNIFDFKLEYVATVKETRYTNSNQSEFMLLKNASKLILPHNEYINFFKDKYNIDFTQKAYYADIDFRSKKVQKIIDSYNVQKLSELDGKPHVVILAGRAVWDKNETRSFGRYYYVDIIENLIRNGFIVHLHTNNIIKSSDEPISYLQDKNNPYFKILISNPGSFFIEPPLDLSIIENYVYLKKYDFGVLHSGVIEDNLFEKFESINIPNRYYEYLSAGVKPICPKGTLKYLENHDDKVLFFDYLDEVKEYFIKKQREIITPYSYFSDLVDLIL